MPRFARVMQAAAHDNYLFGCNTPGKGICPDPVGPDYDFGASPILRTLPDGKQIGHRGNALIAFTVGGK